MAQDTTPWIALSLLSSGPLGVSRALAGAHGDPWAALRTLAGSRTTVLLGEAERLAERLAQGATKVLAQPDPRYPPLLREIPDPPPVIYVRGNLEESDDPSVALVGSRRASTYGQAVARYLGEDLAFGRVTVISGLARGIDTAAHQGALIPPQGRSLAVLAHGPDQLYPPENMRLAGALMERGALLTEFPPGTPPLRANFPRRNRLISALSRGVVVVEAAARSGSLITARHAADQGREVYAVPGPITSETSAGSNELLAQGAHPVRTALDIVGQFPASIRDAVARRRSLPGRDDAPPGLDRREGEVWSLLDCVLPMSVDRLAGQSGLGVGELVSTLLGLEIRGLVRTLPGGEYLRRDWTAGG